mgnify:CR=1 FL=1
MNLELKTLAVVLAVIACCGLCYFWGYRNAETKGMLSIERLKLSQAQQIIDAQNKVKDEYNEKVKALNTDLANARKLNVDRLRQLQTFSSTSRDLEACTRERNELARVAVGFEELAVRADSYFGALVK